MNQRKEEEMDRDAAQAALARLDADRSAVDDAVLVAAALYHGGKLLRSNVATGGVIAVAMCGPDFYRAASDKSVSWQQFAKNSVVHVLGIAGGVGGWVGGAAAGAAIGSAVPLLGTVAGGVIGGILGAVGGGTVVRGLTKSVADEIVEDDAQALIEVLQAELCSLSLEYGLSEGEVEEIIDVVRDTADEEWLRRMYKETGGRREPGRRFVRRKFEREFEKIAKRCQRSAGRSAKHC